jgi:hypothetical protein
MRMPCSGSGGHGGAPNRTGSDVLAARPRNPLHEQLAGRGDVLALVELVATVDVPPEEIRAIALVTAVGQGDLVEVPGLAPRRDRNDDLHVELYRGGRARDANIAAAIIVTPSDGRPSGTGAPTGRRF